MYRREKNGVPNPGWCCLRIGKKTKMSKQYSEQYITWGWAYSAPTLFMSVKGKVLFYYCCLNLSRAVHWIGHLIRHLTPQRYSHLGFYPIKLKYLGEIETDFNNNLTSLSVDQIGVTHEKSLRVEHLVKQQEVTAIQRGTTCIMGAGLGTAFFCAFWTHRSFGPTPTLKANISMMASDKNFFWNHVFLTKCI